MDILRIENDKIFLEGFDLIHSGKITVKEFNHSLVIIPEETEYAVNRHIVVVEDKTIVSPALINVVRKYCKKDSTAFMLMDGVYYQLKNIDL